jgi:stage II sporulation protein D
VRSQPERVAGEPCPAGSEGPPLPAGHRLPLSARGRFFLTPAFAWLVAGAGAWLAMAACRTMQAAGPPAAAASAASAPGVAGKAVRVGILVEVPRVSLGAGDGDVEVRIRRAGASGVQLLRLPRATFRPGTAGRLHLVETRYDLDEATIAPVSSTDLVQVDASAYRGTVEVRPAGSTALTVVNVVGLEDYLRGVVPNELSPQAFPKLEALKAQAVAARTYALAHLGEYAAKGYDLCATAACQVYRGQSSEQPLSDRAVAETKGILATFRGKPINAYYTSTCGGHTEDGDAVFDDAAPYLRGVACLPEQKARQSIRTTAAPLHFALDTGASVRDVALLEALGVLDTAGIESAGLRATASEAELVAWTESLKRSLHRTACGVPPASGLGRRASFARHVIATLCWGERANRLLAPGDTEYLLAPEDLGRLSDPAERQAMALLVREGVLSPGPDNRLRPDAALTRGEALAILAAAALKAGSPAIAEGELAGLVGGELSVLHGDAAESHPIDPSVRLVRDLDGVHASASELGLTVGDRLVYVIRDGRVAYLEAEQSRKGASADASSRYYNWEVRLTPQAVATAVARYGSVGTVKDIVPRRVGVSGRVVELAVVGSNGELVLKGLKVRWGLGLRENLFVVNRETAPDGAVERFVLTGKGWGHGVGLCQVGAFGMAQAGATFEAILEHYYTGITLTRGD